MKMNKCFTTVFDPVLKQEGFTRKGILYYRKVGRMLQGIKLKPINPCMIDFISLPFWLLKKQRSFSIEDLTKGYWVESGGGSIFPSAEFYYKKDEDEYNIQNMKKILELVQRYVLPYLNRMSNEETYSQSSLYGYQRLNQPDLTGEPLVRSGEDSCAEMILYNRYYLNSVITPEEAIETICQTRLQKLLDRDLDDERAIQAEHERINRGREFLLGEVNRLSEEKFRLVYEDMCSDMKQRIAEQLRLEYE